MSARAIPTRCLCPPENSWGPPEWPPPTPRAAPGRRSTTPVARLGGRLAAHRRRLHRRPRRPSTGSSSPNAACSASGCAAAPGPATCGSEACHSRPRRGHRRSTIGSSRRGRLAADPPPGRGRLGAGRQSPRAPFGARADVPLGAHPLFNHLHRRLAGNWASAPCTWTRRSS